MANNNATTGTDTITQFASSDTLTVIDSNQMQAADFFDGGGGIDTIVVGTTGAGTNISIALVPDLRCCHIKSD